MGLRPRVLVLNLYILGGDWAGAVYAFSGCPGDCVGTLPPIGRWAYHEELILKSQITSTITQRRSRTRTLSSNG